MDQQIINKDNCIQMMRSPQARSFIYQYLNSVNAFVDTFNPDPYIHARTAGMRAAGLVMTQMLKEYAPEEYNLMIREQHK